MSFITPKHRSIIDSIHRWQTGRVEIVDFETYRNRCDACGLPDTDRLTAEAWRPAMMELVDEVSGEVVGDPIELPAGRTARVPVPLPLIAIDLYPDTFDSPEFEDLQQRGIVKTTVDPCRFPSFDWLPFRRADGVTVVLQCDPTTPVSVQMVTRDRAGEVVTACDLNLGDLDNDRLAELRHDSTYAFTVRATLLSDGPRSWVVGNYNEFMPVTHALLNLERVDGLGLSDSSQAVAPSETIDTDETRILEALQHGIRYRQQELADIVGLELRTLQNKLRNLRELGLIEERSPLRLTEEGRFRIQA